MPSHPFVPPTASAINRAKGAELDHWISQLNTLSSAQAGQNRKLLTKQGTVDARRRKIVHFLGIDLTQTTSDPPVAGPLTVDKAIGKEHLNLQALTSAAANNDLESLGRLNDMFPAVPHPIPPSPSAPTRSLAIVKIGFWALILHVSGECPNSMCDLANCPANSTEEVRVKK
ncbi:hypothetical protein JB92DRAFT_3145606 [Gautieria morchelliformis]|nr:hypothetical protein JB92DRAFT_3145606 [Gautieria morchelliformis]